MYVSSPVTSISIRSKVSAKLVGVHYLCCVVNRRIVNVLPGAVNMLR